jgi:hypothetical protein
MLLAKPELFARMDQPGGLEENLQTAFALEHATLSPYLTALYSVKPGANQEVRDRIKEVMMEEMLHMTPGMQSPDPPDLQPGPLRTHCAVEAAATNRRPKSEAQNPKRPKTNQRQRIKRDENTNGRSRYESTSIEN